MKNLEKKNFHKYLICLLTGILVVGSISVYAVSTIIDSKEVSYDNKTSNGSYDNVQNSIDELYQKYKYFTGEQDTLYTEKILNGADPVLGKDMIPITLDGKGNVKYANLYTPWYSYEEKKWANAVILVKNPSKSYKTGDTILEKDIESYFVWIPRYSYKIWDLGNYTGYQTLNSLVNNSETATTGDQTALRRIMGNARIIDVRFGKDENLTSIPTTTGVYYTHPAFTNFGVSGLWVGKFETGYNQMDITGVPIDTTGWTTEGAESDVVSSSRIIVKPNVYSWRYIKLSNIFTNTIDYEPDLKSHMMKNTEWGAVAYLSHSIYGIGNEVNINNNESYKTGYSAAANTDKSSWEYGTEDTITQAYNTTTGYLASTTGNITGIYDMNGGCYESVAGYRKGQNTNLSGISDSVLSTYANYFDAYYEGSDTYAYVNRKLGDATGEMGPFYAYYDKDGVSRVHNNWYSDDSAFVDSNNFWFLRSGSFSAGTISGQFSFIRVNGVAGRNIGFRLILAVK